MKESILDLLPFEDVDSDGCEDLVISTDLGMVACLSGGGGNPEETLWSFRSSCNVSTLSSFPDLDGDDIRELIASGADHRVRLCGGKNGIEIWNRLLSSPVGRAYVHKVVCAGDLNHDGTPDVMAWTWDGYLWALNGINGEDVWKLDEDMGFTEAMVPFGDIDGDGLSEFIAGGNDKFLRMCSGKDGKVVWSCFLERPIRDVVAFSDVDDDGTTDCVGVTAGGRVALVSGEGSGSVLPIWKAETGDVCRKVISPGDLDGDDRPDVVVCAENGIITALSGVDGNELWRHQGQDVIRDLALAGDADQDGICDIGAACLDGSVMLLPGNPAKYAGSGDNKQESIVILSGDKDSDRRQTATVEEVPILLYHDVLPEAIYAYSCSVDQFRAQMDLLVSGDFECVSLDQIADWIEGKIELPEKPVCITFDGPYDGHHTHACPILKERGLFAVSYITTDWIGTANHADWHQLREMQADGVMDIQNHTINHPPLAGLDRNGVLDQLRGCNEAIKRRMGEKVLHHAYPGGSYNSFVMDILREEGFRTATTTESRHAKRTDDPMALPRYCVLKQTSLETFKIYIRYDGPTPTPSPTPPPEDLLPYLFSGTVGSGWKQPSYADVDSSGTLWICDYTDKSVRIFDSKGKELNFSPITQGLNTAGETVPIEAPSGIAVTPSDEILVSICDYFGDDQYLGLFRYRATDGESLSGFDLTYKPGDVDCDSQGMIFVVNKTEDEWHVYKPNGTELPGSPFGPGTEDHVQRGISVRPDSTRVYIISETDLAVHVWSGHTDTDGAEYTRTPDLVAGLSSRSGGVDVMDNGNILVGDDGNNRILGYYSNHTFWGYLIGGTPPLAQPRGTAFSPNGERLWIICKNGFVQLWEHSSTGIQWLIY